MQTSGMGQVGSLQKRGFLDTACAGKPTVEQMCAFTSLVYGVFFCEIVEMKKELTLNAKTPCRDGLEEISKSGKIAMLEDCELSELNLSGIDLSGWHFVRCRLTRTTLNGANLDESSFTACRAAGASFGGSNLQEATIEGGDFSNTNFRGATLTHTKVINCKLTGSDFTDARTLGISIENVLLVLAILPRLSFRKMTLKDVDFSEADLRACDFRDTVFENCSLRDAHLPECRFEGADLRNADLGGIKLTNAQLFKGALISKRQAADLLSQLGLKVL